ncbi:hypothetical protein NN561_005985 [Cricetulus griseus]
MRRYLIPYWWLRVRTPRFPHSKAGEAGHGAQRLSQDLERMVAPDFASPEHRASRASPHPGAPGQTAFAPSGNKKRNPRDHHPPPHRLLICLKVMSSQTRNSLPERRKNKLDAKSLRDKCKCRALTSVLELARYPVCEVNALAGEKQPVARRGRTRTRTYSSREAANSLELAATEPAA